MDVIYGVHPVAECLKAGRRKVHRIWAADKDRLAELKQEVGRALSSPAEAAPRDLCARKSGTPHHQGLVAEVGEYPYVDWEDLLDPYPLPAPRRPRQPGRIPKMWGPSCAAPSVRELPG